MDRRSGNSIRFALNASSSGLAYPIGILSANPYARSRCMP